MNPELERTRDIILDIIKKTDARTAGLFNSSKVSQSNGEQMQGVLVDFETKKGLLQIVKIKKELEEALGKEVDFRTYTSLDPMLRDEFLLQQEIILSSL